MEQQVAEAALALVRPSTDNATRSTASSFLERWTRTSGAWIIYIKWLQSFQGNSFSSYNDVSSEVLGTKLLCLTLLLAKIRREIPLNADKEVTQEMTEAIRNEVWSLLQVVQQSQLISPLCSCLASLVVRSNQIGELIESFSQQDGSSGAISPTISLKLLALLPPELESCGYLTSPQINIEIVLGTIRKALYEPSLARSALECLSGWTQTCHITLSHLNSSIQGGNNQFLSILVQILSQPSGYEEGLWILASNVLTEAIVMPTDSCTPSRQAAVTQMIAAISEDGFIAAPFQFCTTNRWDDGAHALANLMCTLVSEEVDYLCAEPADSYIGLLLQIQAHPHSRVALTVLECWLTVQDIPNSDRHEHWKEPLFATISEGLVKRLAYTRRFTTWEDEVELDEQEFTEYRRMVTDVLVNCYLLLRIQFLQQMTTTISNGVSNQDWTLMEAALFCLAAIFREVCSRLKTKENSSSQEKDQIETAQQILCLVGHLCGSDSAMAVTVAAQQHFLVLVAACKFMGLYAPAWNIYCGEAAILQILKYLHTALKMSSSSQQDACIAKMAASSAIRSIYVNCANKLLHLSVIHLCLKESIEAAVSTYNKDALAAIAEGCARLIAQMKDSNQVIESFESILLPLMQKAEESLNNATGSKVITQREMAVDTLAVYLHSLHVVVRFCDAQNETAPPLTNALSSILSLLQRSAQQCGYHDSIMDEVVAVHRQLLSNTPKLVIPCFPETVKLMVEAYEKSKHPSTLQYLEFAVETFSPMNGNDEKSFRGLLAHVTKVTRIYLSTEKCPDACPQVVQGFFEMIQRYILYCPGGLVRCSEFSNIVSMGVECLTACKGERESTRATLNFLAQLFGWSFLRLSDATSKVLQNEASTINDEVMKHGGSIVSTCVNALVGGPQMLWPAISDCIIAIIMHILGINIAAPEAEENTIAHEWVYSSLISSTASSGKPLPVETCQQILKILFKLVKQGGKYKAKAKMLLTDYAKICRGEMAEDALLSYALDASEV